MFDFHERRKLRNVIYSRPILVLLGILILMFSYGVWGAWEKEYEIRAKTESSATVLNDLQSRKQGLQEKISELNTERGVEAEIRNKFEVAKDGEKVIFIVHPSDETATETPKTAPKGFWSRLFGL